MKDDDLKDIDDLLEEPHKGYNRVALITIILVSIALIISVYYMYSSSKDKNDDQVIIISADEEEIKVQPLDPGGMVVSNMDKTIYDSIDGNDREKEKSEILLPPSEEPIDRKEILLKTEFVDSQEKILTSDDDVSANKIVESKKQTAKAKSLSKEKAKVTEVSEEVIESSKEEYIKPIPQKETKVKAKFVKKSESFYKIQIASFKSSGEAQKEWNNLSKKFPKLIGIYKHYIVTKNIEGKGIFYRLQVGPFDSESKAYDKCNKFKGSGINCFIIKP